MSQNIRAVELEVLQDLDLWALEAHLESIHHQSEAINLHGKLLMQTQNFCKYLVAKKEYIFIKLWTSCLNIYLRWIQLSLSLTSVDMALDSCEMIRMLIK